MPEGSTMGVTDIFLIAGWHHPSRRGGLDRTRHRLPVGEWQDETAMVTTAIFAVG
jgi:hypothetical protein